MTYEFFECIVMLYYLLINIIAWHTKTGTKTPYKELLQMIGIGTLTLLRESPHSVYAYHH